LFEHCGIIGIYSLEEKNVVPMLLAGLEALQHRGQESWGIAVLNHQPYKRMGLVSSMEEETFREITELGGNVAVGHVRYSTTSKPVLENAHPLEIGKSNRFYICHNGTLDRDLLVSRLKNEGYSPDRSITDSELLGLGLHHHLKRGLSWVEAFETTNPDLNGSFSLTILTDKGELLAARDDRGFRPLCLGWHDETDSYIIASESCALDILGARLIRDVRPGEILKVDEDGIEEQCFSDLERHAHCAFEYTYFAHPGSYIEGVNVYHARKSIGMHLAEKYPIDGDVVVPVPDSARPAALGYSKESGIRFEEGLMKDRYRRKGSWRSFIEPGKRDEIVLNITPIRNAVEGKKVILVDDSIVRGTSSKIIVKEKLKDAKDVSLLLTFPPIMFPCYMGIDFPTQEELLAYRVSGTTQDIDEINRKVAEEIDVKFLGYNDIDSLSKGIGLPKDQLCLACTTGDYCLKQKLKFRTREEMRS